MNPLVSVIIPVYSSEKYLPYALESLLKNSFTSWEAILIDDCSIDSSSDIIKRYQEKYPTKIKSIFFDINRKQGAARNAGIKIAQGEYISFLDSDDLYSPLFLETAYNILSKENADVIRIEPFTFGNLKKEQFFLKKNGLDKKDTFISKYHEISKYQTGANICLFAKIDLVKSTNLFPENCFGEDIIFCADLYSRAKKIILLEDKLYGYRKMGFTSQLAKSKKISISSTVLLLDKLNANPSFILAIKLFQVTEYLKKELISIINIKKEAADVLNKDNWPQIVQSIKNYDSKIIKEALNEIKGRKKIYMISFLNYILKNGSLYSFRKRLLLKKIF